MCETRNRNSSEKLILCPLQIREAPLQVSPDEQKRILLKHVFECDFELNKTYRSSVTTRELYKSCTRSIEGQESERFPEINQNTYNAQSERHTIVRLGW